MSTKRALEQMRAPGERAAEDRAWAVVRSAYRERAPIASGRSRRGVVAGLTVALAISAVSLSPAGATVGRLITRALGIQRAAPALSTLPTPGRLLVSGSAGTWTVSADGSLRRLGPWPQASWSPHGRYLAVAGGDRLAAIDPRGVTQWTLIRPGVSDPRWYSPSGYRIAYRSDRDLRVLAGDGSGDHLLAVAVANVPPSWRPGHAYELAYISAGGALLVRDADTGQLVWRRSAAPRIARLQWSADGRYLLAISPRTVWLYTASGLPVTRVATGPVIDGALSPDGRRLAVVLGGATNEVVLESLLTRHSARRRVILTGVGLRQVLWSPDSHWLLVSWPAANQWVFVRATGQPRITAVSRISQQFSQNGAFPELDGWCCTAASR